MSLALLATTVDELKKLKGAFEQAHDEQQRGKSGRASASLSLEEARAEGKALRTEFVARTRMLRSLDKALEGELALIESAPGDDEQLAGKLDKAAAVVRQLVTHTNAHVRAMAAARGLDEGEASEMASIAEAIRQASQNKGVGPSARREEGQARLDVQDGFCLLFVGEVLRALRSMARRTRKVRRPVLHGLAHYFGQRSKSDEEPAPTPPAT